VLERVQLRFRRSLCFFFNWIATAVSQHAYYADGIIYQLTYIRARVTNLFETDSYGTWYRFMRWATSLIHTSEIKICSLRSSIMSTLLKIKEIHHCEDTDHVYAIVRTSPRATWCPQAHVGDPCIRASTKFTQPQPGTQTSKNVSRALVCYLPAR